MDTVAGLVDDGLLLTTLAVSGGQDRLVATVEGVTGGPSAWAEPSAGAGLDVAQATALVFVYDFVSDRRRGSWAWTW